MGTLLRPVGPLPPSVYWTRRMLLLAAAVVVLFTAVQLWPTGGGDANAAGTARSTPSSAPTGAGKPAPKSTGAPASTDPKATPTGTGIALPVCADGDIEVSTRTDARQYQAGVRPRLTLVVTNVSGQACRRDLGSKPLTLLITSGSQRMWSSDDCATSSRSSIRTLEPGKEFTSSVSWARLTSAPGCKPASRRAAAPGTYVLTAAAGTASGGRAVFSLR